MEKTGFTLIELIIVLSIIGVISALSYPAYTNHLLRVRRSHVAIMLLDVAGRMEKYFLLNNGYQDATLEKLSVDNASYKNYYEISVFSGGSNYELEAVPINVQAKDVSCGALKTDQDGNKSIGGDGGVLKCWG